MLWRWEGGEGGNGSLIGGYCTAKTKWRKFETNIPRKGISGPQSQFPHSYVCEAVSELYIPTMGLPVLLEEISRLILGIQYINRSQTHECGNWG